MTLRGCLGPANDDIAWNRAMSRLQKRISKTKEAAVTFDKAIAANWRSANFKMAYLGESSSIGGAVRALEVRDQMVATATAVGEVCIQSLPGGHLIAQLSSPEGISGELTAMDFDGSTVIAGFASGEVAAWDIAPMLTGGVTSMSNDELSDKDENSEKSISNAKIDESSDSESIMKKVKAAGAPIILGVHSDNRVPVTGINLCRSTNRYTNILSKDGALSSLLPAFVSSSADGLIRCWDGIQSTTGTYLRSEKGPVCCINTLANYVIAGTMTGHILIWSKYAKLDEDLDPILTFRAHQAQVTALQHYSGSSNDTLITGGADGLVRVWDMSRGGGPIHEFKGHDDGITSVQSDSSKVVSAGLDNTVRVWDPFTGKQLYRLNGEATDAISARFEGPWLVWNGISRSVLLLDYSAKLDLA